MTTLLNLLDSYLFAGITGGIAYDIVKASWEAITKKTWDDYFLDAFQTVFSDQQEYLRKYAKDGVVEINRKELEIIIHQDLGISLEHKTFEELSDKQFINELAKQLTSQQNVLIIGGNALEEIDYYNIVLALLDAASAKFQKTISKNENLFREAVLKSAKSNRDALQSIQIHMLNRFGIVIDFLDEITNSIETQTTEIKEIKADIKTILKYLNLNRPRTEISAEIRQSLTLNQDIIIEQANGIDGEFQLQPMPERYFIAESNNQQDLRNSIERSLERFGKKSIQVNDFYYTVSVLNKLKALILATPFSIFQLDDYLGGNTYFQLGLALGYNKPFVLIRNHVTKLAGMLENMDVYEIDSYLRMRYELGDKVNDYLTQAMRYQLQTVPTAVSKKMVVIAHGELEQVDISMTLARILVENGYEPTFLGHYQHKLAKYLEQEGLPCNFAVRREDMVKGISTAEFGIYRVDSSANPDALITLGLAMALNRPVLLIHNSRNIVPTNLEGLGALPFEGFTDLEEKFRYYFPQWYAKINV